MAEHLDEALAEGNGEKAVRPYWDLVDQACGKTTQQLEVKAGRWVISATCRPKSSSGS